MANVYTKDNGFGKTVIFSQKASDAFGYCHSAFVNNKVLIIILDVVLTIINFITINISLPRNRTPALQVLVNANPKNLIWSKKSIINALLQAVGIYCFTEVGDVRNLFCLFRRCCHTDLCCAVEILKYLAPP